MWVPFSVISSSSQLPLFLYVLLRLVTGVNGSISMVITPVDMGSRGVFWSILLWVGFPYLLLLLQLSLWLILLGVTFLYGGLNKGSPLDQTQYPE